MNNNVKRNIDQNSDIDSSYSTIRRFSMEKSCVKNGIQFGCDKKDFLKKESEKFSKKKAS